jgi:4-hydroxybenzoate polyprenyltransferase
MFIKIRVDGTIRLSRYREYLWFVVITSLLGAGAAAGVFGIRLLTVLVANELAVAFMFMINDVEDAPDDALTPHKAARNPIVSGHLSLRSGWWASTLVALLAGFLFLLLGIGSALCGWIALLLGYIYSWRKIRLKNLPILDMVSHSMMLAGLQFLVGFLAFQPGIHWWWFFPFMMVTSISLYGELFNELRDLHGDRQAGLRHSAAIFGYQPAKVLMFTFLSIGILCTIVTLLVLPMIPWWVIALTAILLAILAVPPILRVRRLQRNAVDLQAPFQKPFEIAFAVALFVWFFLPWIAEQLGSVWQR